MPIFAVRVREEGVVGSRRRRPRSRPSPEVLEGRALMAVAFGELPINDVFSFVTGADGNFWYTSNSSIDQIDRLTVAGALTKFPLSSDFKDVEQLAAGPDGNVWFTESVASTSPTPVSSRIGRITPTGAITEFLLPAKPGTWKTLGDLEPGPGGGLWFVEYQQADSGGPTSGLIGRITPSGQVTEFNAPGVPGPPLLGPGTKIAGGADGDLWYTEPGVGKIGRISPSGVVTQFAVPGYLPALAITPGPDGNVWFTEADGVGRVTPGGAVTLFNAPGVDDYTNMITTGPDGNVWFTEADGVGRVTPGGAVTEYVTPQVVDMPTQIGIGPQRALLFTYTGGDFNLGVIHTQATATPPKVTATAEASPQYETIATEVARFTGSDPGATIADYRAVIQWSGNGQPRSAAQGIIEPDPSGGFDVYASGDGAPDNYPVGTYTATVTIFDTRAAGASMATATGTLAVTPSGGVAAGPTPQVTIDPTGLVTAAASTSADGTLPANTYTATFTFGDGSPAVAATIAAATFVSHPDVGTYLHITTFTAQATHRYARVGVYTVTVTFRDRSGNVLANDSLFIDL